jgi:hypothetical protein
MGDVLTDALAVYDDAGAWYVDEPTHARKRRDAPLNQHDTAIP